MGSNYLGSSDKTQILDLANQTNVHSGESKVGGSVAVPVGFIGRDDTAHVKR